MDRSARRLARLAAPWLGHALALGLLVTPLAGHRFVPAVDLPNHLAVVRVASDHLHGAWPEELELNLRPAYKPVWLLALAIYEVLPDALRPWYPAWFLAAVAALFYGCTIAALRILAGPGRAAATEAALASAVALLFYSPAFYWGLLGYLAAVGVAVLAFACFVRWLACGERRWLLAFYGATAASHLTHPMSSLFLAVLVGIAAAVGVAREPARARWIVGALAAWLPGIALLHRLSFAGGAGVDLRKTLASLGWPLQSVPEAWRFLLETFAPRPWLPNTVSGELLVPRVALTAGFLLVAAGLCLALAWGRRREIGLLAAIAGACFAAFVLLRHDLLALAGPVWTWYPVRFTPLALGAIFALLGAAILILLREPERPWLRAACVALSLAIGVQASASLRRHFRQFDEAAATHYASGRRGWPDRTQHYRYDYHFGTYRCLFEPRCETLQDLWFVRYPDLPIYLLSTTGRGQLP
jgi:hypothetical protein